MNDMSSLFSFDEEKLARDFNDTIIEDELELDELDARPYDGNTLKVHSETAFPRNIPRRKSSVYRRLSIKSAASVTSQDLTIPANYEYSDEGTSESNVSSKRKVLSDFKPIKVLGKGAYGKVHLVQDRHSNKLFAQKQLRKPTINIHEEQVDLTKHVKRTISERQILTNITHHPNIVKLFYALQDADKFYLILEYIPGGELFHHLTSNNSLGNVFKEDDVAFYAAQMALGLKHLHGLGIVYRDLKPENCLLNSAGHLVLTDFGLSKSIGENSQDSCTSIIGTPEYMAPEILKGDKYDYLVDWWSLGCVIYDMMTGKPPFTGNSHKVIQDKIIKNKLKMPFYFSMDAKDLLNKLLNKNPAKRFPVDEKWALFESHRFFRKINWTSLNSQEDSCNPPIIPVITDPILAENFSEEFTSMAISDFSGDQGINIPQDPNYNRNDLFKGFSYTASNSFIDRYC